MKTRNNFIVAVFIIICLLAACNPQASPTPTPILPTATFTPAPTPTPIDYTITAENAHLIEELDRMGRGEINAITVSPDGEELIVISAIGVWVYSMETGEVLHFFEGDPLGNFYSFKSVPCPTWPPDSYLLAVPLKEGKVWIFNTSTWEVIAENINTLSDFTCIAWASDSQFLADDEDRRSVWTWSRYFGYWETDPNYSSVQSCVSGTDEDQLMLLGYQPENGRGIYNVETRELLSQVSSRRRYGIVWTPDCETYLPLQEFNAEVFNRGTIDEYISGGWHTVFAWSPDGRYITMAGSVHKSIDYQQLVIYDNWNDIVISDTLQDEEIIALTWTPDGELLAISNKEAGQILWVTATGEELFHLTDHMNASSLLLLGKNSTVITANRYTFDVWNYLTGDLVTRLKVNQSVWSNDNITLSRDGKLLAFQDQEHTVRIWDLQDEEYIEQLAFGGRVQKLSWSPKGDRLLIEIFGDLWVVSFNLDGIKLDLRSVDWSEYFWGPEGGLFRVITAYEYRQIYNADSKEHLMTIPSEALFVSPDGMKLVVPITIKPTSSFLIYELEQGNLVGNIRAYRMLGKFNWDSLRCSPDGSLIALYTQVHNDEYQIVIVDANTAEKIAYLNVDSVVNQLNWSNDGTKLFFSDYSGIIHIWGLP